MGGGGGGGGAGTGSGGGAAFSAAGSPSGTDMGAGAGGGGGGASGTGAGCLDFLRRHGSRRRAPTYFDIAGLGHHTHRAAPTRPSRIAATAAPNELAVPELNVAPAPRSQKRASIA